jgi:hypothetical protein
MKFSFDCPFFSNPVHSTNPCKPKLEVIPQKIEHASEKMLNYLTHFLPTKLAWYSAATFWLGLTSDKKG